MDGHKFMVAAGSSGSGKTVIACGLMAAFKQQGMKVAACKCGPDYIDPMFHQEVLGIASENLDLFFCSPTVMKELFQAHTKGSDVTVIEGVMGYYDGMSLTSEKASSYDVARSLDIPVILIVPCKGMALSVMPFILGMIEFRRDSNIQGIILNRVSERLYPKMKEMIEKELRKRGYGIPVVGYVPEDEAFHLESRHLGLITPQEIEGILSRLMRAGEILSRTVDFERLLGIGRAAAGGGKGHTLGEKAGAGLEALKPEAEEPGPEDFNHIKIGIAKDEAFCFYYKDNLELLEKLGCELVAFSPLHDTALPEGISGVILGGGYPELYTDMLSANQRMLFSIRSAIEQGMPCLAECGGFMYLHGEMEGKDGLSYPMAGVIKGRAVRTEKLVRFGYIELRAQKDGMYFQKGDTLRGHEFHYWDSTENGTDCLAVKPDGKRSWECIHMSGSLFAGYPHIHFYSNPVFARRFVHACRAWKYPCH